MYRSHPSVFAQNSWGGKYLNSVVTRTCAVSIVIYLHYSSCVITLYGFPLNAMVQQGLLQIIVLHYHVKTYDDIELISHSNKVKIYTLPNLNTSQLAAITPDHNREPNIE